jgi:hypothetical protein
LVVITAFVWNWIIRQIVKTNVIPVKQCVWVNTLLLVVMALTVVMSGKMKTKHIVAEVVLKVSASLKRPFVM